MRSAEYQKYLIARDYKPSKVKKQFSDVRNISRDEARKLEIKSNFSTTCNLITQYNPMLPNIKTVFKKYLTLLHSNQEMLRVFPENTINVTYKRNQNLKELISPSLFPKIIKENNCSIEKCSRRCDICKNFLVVSTEFTCHVTRRKYKIRGTLTCNTKKMIYLITCKSCSKQYIGYATSFKQRFRIHKSDISTGKVRCEVANHLLNVCKSALYKTEYLQVQLIE